MKVLFIHKRLPAQFKYLMLSLANDKRNQIYGICQDNSSIIKDEKFSNIRLSSYSSKEDNATNIHPYAKDFEKCAKRGQKVAQILLQFKQDGIKFDFAIAHLGWGEALFFKDIFPKTPLIGYSEYYYHAKGADVGFDPSYRMSKDSELMVRTLNAHVLLGMMSTDICITPTNWQKSLFPAELRPKIRVIHEGVDTDKIKPNSNITLPLPNGVTLTKQDEVITYTARNLEPYRGFPVFMRAVEEICQRRPDCHIIIAGGDEVSYSKKLPDGQCYRTQTLNNVNIDENRVHFLGVVPYNLHLELLQLSSAHIYLTYPFVLSWSFMEALASGCVIIASATPPVKEVLQHQYNGLLVDFFDHLAIADQVDNILAHPNRMQQLANNARKTVHLNYTLKNALEQYRFLYEQLLPKTH